MSEPRVSFWSNGAVGFHLTLNPQSALPPSARIYRRFVQHGIPLSDRQLGSLLAGRAEGIASIDATLRAIAPTLGAETRLRLSTQLADALMNHSLNAQLSREAPTALQQVQQRDQVLQHLFRQAAPPGTDRGMAPTLLRRLPRVGVSLTVHF